MWRQGRKDLEEPRALIERIGHVLFESTTKIPTISPQEASDTCTGPWYHGTSEDNLSAILDQGFSWHEGEAREGNTAHGYENHPYIGSRTNYPPPVHHLGYGAYLTKSKTNAKNFGGKVAEFWILKGARIEEINWGAPNTMMKWWLKNGYDGELALKDRVAATKALTRSLSSRFDAVYYKGKALRRLLDGDQICIYNLSILRRVDKSLAKPGEAGTKVIKTGVELPDRPGYDKIPVGMKGTVVSRRVIEPQYQSYHPGEKEWVTVKWQKGGTTQVYGSHVKSL